MEKKIQQKKTNSPNESCFIGETKILFFFTNDIYANNNIYFSSRPCQWLETDGHGNRKPNKRGEMVVDSLGPLNVDTCNYFLDWTQVLVSAISHYRWQTYSYSEKENIICLEKHRSCWFFLSDCASFFFQRKRVGQSHHQERGRRTSCKLFTLFCLFVQLMWKPHMYSVHGQKYVDVYRITPHTS